ncbi:MAG: C4-dicarboxylate TRAP transporter substrate-binding protein [Candidatus Thiodiazotropha sp.]
MIHQVKLAALAATFFASSFSALPLLAETTLTWGEPSPNRGQRAADVQWFADQVEKRSAGDLKIKIQWGGALYKAKAARQSIATGVADMGSIIQAYFPKELVSYSIGDLPFPNEDPWVGIRAVSDHMKNPKIDAQLAKQNLKFIAPFTVSKVVLLCKGDAVRKLDDIKGKKVRGISGYGKAFGDLGANMVSMSIYKAYQGLDTGLIDCTHSYLAPSAALKHGEVADSATRLNWGIVTGLGMYMNKRVYDGLSDSQKEVLASAAKDFVDHHGRNALTGDVNGEKKLKAAGVEFIDLPKADSAKLVAAGEKYIGEWAKQASASGFDGDAMVKQFREALNNYSRERDEKGYPWAR